MPRKFQVFFCDDVRREIRGKNTLVGLYGTEMTVADLPANLPKLSILIRMQMMKDEIPKELSWIIRGIDGIEFEAPVSSEQLAEMRRSASKSKLPHKKTVTVDSNLELMPFGIPKEGYLRVYSKIEGRKSKIGELYIAKGDVS